MKKLLKPSSIGFYILMLLVCFIIGLYFAGDIDAGKNQGLAGGAIVVGYGVLFAGVGFIASFFIAYYVATKLLVKINVFLLILLLAAIGYKYFEFQQRDKLEKEESEKFDPPSTTPTPQTEPLGMAKLYSRHINDGVPQKILNEENSERGMGFFSPNYYESPTLYFYGNLNLEKSLMDHAPYDSITFKRNKFNQFEIATAPPFLVPEYLKLDYDRLYFKVMSVSEDFIEVVVNKTNGQTSYVDRRAGRLIYWPEFLLSMHSVEFLPYSKEKVRERSFENSSEVKTPYQFMRVVQVKGDWLRVLLLNSDFKTVANGWIQWKREGKLLIMYNLLS